MAPEAVYIPVINLYFSESGSIRVLVLLILVWEMIYPLKKACRGGGIAEAAYNLLPVEVFLLFVFAQYQIVITGILLVLFLIACELIFRWTDTEYASQIYKKKKWKRNSRESKNLRSRMECRLIVLCAAIIFLVPSAVSIAVYSLKQPLYSVEREENAYIKKGSQEKKQTAWQMLKADEKLQMNINRWKELSIDKKMETVQSIADMEAAYLGIWDAGVKSIKLNMFVLGKYDNRKHEIWIDVQHLQKDTFEECCITILHEVYHSYQHYVVDSVDWEHAADCLYYNEAKEWADNFKNYVRGYNDYDGYYNQKVEADARAFAEKESKILCSIVEKK